MGSSNEKENEKNVSQVGKQNQKTIGGGPTKLYPMENLLPSYFSRASDTHGSKVKTNQNTKISR